MLYCLFLSCCITVSPTLEWIGKMVVCIQHEIFTYTWFAAVCCYLYCMLLLCSCYNQAPSPTHWDMLSPHLIPHLGACYPHTFSHTWRHAIPTPYPTAGGMLSPYLLPHLHLEACWLPHAFPTPGGTRWVVWAVSCQQPWLCTTVPGTYLSTRESCATQSPSECGSQPGMLLVPPCMWPGKNEG